MTSDPPLVEVSGPSLGAWRCHRGDDRADQHSRSHQSVVDTVTIGVEDSSVRLRSQRTAVVTIEIRPAPVERVVDHVPVELRNPGSRLTSSASPREVTVRLRGPAKAVSALRGDRSQGVCRPLGTGTRTLQSSGAVRSSPGDDHYQRRAGAASTFASADMDPVSSGPMAFAARRARRRSTRRPCGASARRWSRPLDPSDGHPHLLIGRDTRESGEWIERELAAGRPACGRRRQDRRRAADAGGRLSHATTDVTLGAVISASHNPYEDNGIKVFSGAGHKFNEDRERLVETIVADPAWRLDGGRRAVA